MCPWRPFHLAKGSSFNGADVERRVLDALAEGAEQIDQVTVQLQCVPAEALAALTSLEIRGLVVQTPGKVFHRAHPASVA